MSVVRVDHVVGDFDMWKQAFDSDPVGREAGGVRGYRILRPVGERDHVLVDLEFAAAEEAQAFAEKLRALWNEAGARLGLEDPSARVLEEVEAKTY
jgi:hypothetical protein